MLFLMKLKSWRIFLTNSVGIFLRFSRVKDISFKSWKVERLKSWNVWIVKDISFALQKTVFWSAKDKLSEGESLAFASETYIFRM